MQNLDLGNFPLHMQSKSIYLWRVWSSLRKNIFKESLWNSSNLTLLLDNQLRHVETCSHDYCKRLCLSFMTESLAFYFEWKINGNKDTLGAIQHAKRWGSHLNSNSILSFVAFIVLMANWIVAGMNSRASRTLSLDYKIAALLRICRRSFTKIRKFHNVNSQH